MATLMIRDPYGNEFPVDATARRYWEHREGYEILPDPELGPEDDTPAPQGETSAPEPDKTGAPKTSQRAARAAHEVKEQPGG